MIMAGGGEGLKTNLLIQIMYLVCRMNSTKFQIRNKLKQEYHNLGPK